MFIVYLTNMANINNNNVRNSNSNSRNNNNNNRNNNAQLRLPFTLSGVFSFLYVTSLILIGHPQITSIESL